MPLYSNELAVRCRCVIAVAASAIPTEIAALPTLKIGSTAPSIIPMPWPGAVSARLAGSETSRSVIGALALPRMPSASQVPATPSPASLLSTR